MLPRQRCKLYKNILFLGVFLLPLYYLLHNNHSYPAYCSMLVYLINPCSDCPLLCHTGHIKLTSLSLDFLICNMMMIAPTPQGYREG